MKFLTGLLIYAQLLSSFASGQIIVSNGVVTNHGDKLSTTPGGTSGTPDDALLNWDTSLANSPAPGSNICVGTLNNASALPGRCGTTYTTANLQAALNGATCGQTIVLQNTTYVGRFTAPAINATCAQNNWVVVERDVTDPIFPAEHNRVDPCYMGIPQSAMFYYPYPGVDSTPNSCARHMPQFNSNLTSGTSTFGVATPAGGTGASIAYWRFIGIEFTRSNNFDLSFGVVDFTYQPSIDCALTGTGASALPLNPAACAAGQPTHIILDRCVIHGDAQRQTAFGFKLGGSTWVALVDSYIYDISETFAGGGGDAQSITWGTGHGYTGVGEGKFTNNFNAASTQSCIQVCGGFVEPVNPVTHKDGVPESIVFSANYWWKNPRWNTQLGQTKHAIVNLAGQSYSPVGDQELQVSPTAIQLQAGQTYQFNTTWLNDSAGGINRLIAPAAGSVLVDGVSFGNSIVGLITKNGEHTVGSGAWLSQNQITYTYTVCTGVGLPVTNCNGVTTPGTHTITFNAVTQDNRLCTGAGTPVPSCTVAGSLQGKSRTLTATATVTVVSAAPTQQIALSPKAPDLSIQPSYSDAFGNTRQFAVTLFASLNYTSTSMTWKVDGTVNGNPSVGQICSAASAACVAPGTNDLSAVYVSGTATGSHTISANSANGTSDTSVINVSTSASIVNFDLKADTSKNIFELKCGRRILVQNNFGQVAFGSNGNGGGQGGEGFLFQTGNQVNQTNDGSGTNVGYGPEIIADINVDHNQISDVGQGIATASLNAALGEHRVQFTHDVFDDMNNVNWQNGFLGGNTSQTLQFSGASCQKPPCKVLPWTSPANPLIDNIILRHLTVVGNVTSLVSITNNNSEFQLGPFTMQDSILAANGSSTFANNFGDPNDCNTASGSGSLNTEARALEGTGYSPPLPCTSKFTFDRLLLLDSTASPSVFDNVVSPHIWQAASTDPTVFRGFNGDVNADLRVVAGGLYDAGGARQASDGLALGADVAAVNTAVATAKCGATVCATTLDLLDWVLMPLPNRASFHMHGVGSDTYSVLDTDALYPAGYPSGTFFWDKHSTGNPWDIEKYNSTYAALHLITEDGDTVDQQTCINNGFPNGCWGDPNAYKRFPNPVPIMPRFFASGSTVTIDTPGPNTFVRTTNCELPGTSTNVNLGDVSAVTTGPFNMTWAGSIDSGTGVVGLSGPTIDNVNGVPTMRNDYYYGGPLSTRNFNDKESTFYVLGFGRVAWFFYKKVSGTYVEQQHTINNITTSGQVAPNFPCGAGHSWWN